MLVLTDRRMSDKRKRECLKTDIRPNSSQETSFGKFVRKIVALVPGTRRTRGFQSFTCVGEISSSNQRWQF